MTTHRGERGRFRDVLDRFEREGCNLLVVGEADPEVRRAASRRLFGAADRDGVLVATTDVDPDRWLPGDGVAIDVDVGMRSAAPADAVPPATVPDAVEFDSDVPRQSRLGVTAVDPLLDTSVLASLRRAVDRVNGLGHYHLHAPDDAVRARSLAAEYDAVVELQRTADGARERWHVPEEDLTTGWVRID